MKKTTKEVALSICEKFQKGYPKNANIIKLMLELEEEIELLLKQQSNEFSSDKKIKKAADKWERKASCGHFQGAYINDDFVAGVEWVKIWLKNHKK